MWRTDLGPCHWTKVLQPFQVINTACCGSIWCAFIQTGVNCVFHRLQQHREVPEPYSGYGGPATKCLVPVLFWHTGSCDSGSQEERPLWHGHSGYDGMFVINTEAKRGHKRIGLLNNSELLLWENRLNHNHLSALKVLFYSCIWSKCVRYTWQMIFLHSFHLDLGSGDEKVKKVDCRKFLTPGYTTSGHVELYTVGFVFMCPLGNARVGLHRLMPLCGSLHRWVWRGACRGKKPLMCGQNRTGQMMGSMYRYQRPTHNLTSVFNLQSKHKLEVTHFVFRWGTTGKRPYWWKRSTLRRGCSWCTGRTPAGSSSWSHMPTSRRSSKRLNVFFIALTYHRTPSCLCSGSWCGFVVLGLVRRRQAALDGPAQVLSQNLLSCVLVCDPSITLITLRFRQPVLLHQIASLCPQAGKL